jgi:uncharacterized membrane protein YtjA (UPF0391 family)
MLRLAIIFLIVSIVAGALGFTGIARTSGKIAGILFFIAILFFAIFVGMVVLAVMAGDALF